MLGFNSTASEPLSGSGSESITATISWLEADDVMSLVVTAGTTLAGQIQWTEESDVFSISAQSRANSTVTWTESDDIFSLNLLATKSVALAWTEADDQFNIYVSVDAPLIGNISWTESSDVWNIVVHRELTEGETYVPNAIRTVVVYKR